MSAEDDTSVPETSAEVSNNQAAENRRSAPKAKKKAAKKRARKTAAKQTKRATPTNEPDEVVDMTSRMEFSPDDDSSPEDSESKNDVGPKTEEPSGAAGDQGPEPSEGTSTEKAEKAEKAEKGGKGGGKPSGGGEQDPRPGKRSSPGESVPHGGNAGQGQGSPNRGNKFKNKRQKNQNKKQRWKDKKRKSREEETPIELGGLLEDEALERVESIADLAEALSGGGEPLDYDQVYTMGLPELREAASGLAAELPHAPNREQLINALTADAGKAKRPVMATGVLDLLDEDEGGLLVYEHDSYRVKALSAFVPQVLIERYGLQRGHIVKAQLHPHREDESCPFVVKVESVMSRDPETLAAIVPFTERVPYYPTSRILMESESEGKWDNLSMRVVDCLTPVGFGQRGLIVAPPRTGKTVLMQGMANAIQKNYPEAHLIILLVDERPEEVTDFRRQVDGEVICSTFDESAESHVHAAEMVIEKARRMVEVGQDVVILLDSITRLARAYNTTMPNSGKILSGGVEANALQKPKRFFGSARNIEDGGSLTIIATALVETGSKMDEVIFEEFKGTGNMELHLDRGLSDKRIYPALGMDRSGTRKEELLYHPDEMQKIYSLRRAMKGLPSTEAMEMLIQRIKKTGTNAEFLMSVAR